MKTIEFKEVDWGILTMGMAWTNLYCPYCKKYHSRSFFFEFERDKTEYIGMCQMCKKEIKIIINKEENNSIIEAIDKRYNRVMADGNKPLTEFIK